MSFDVFSHMFPPKIISCLAYCFSDSVMPSLIVKSYQSALPKLRWYKYREQRTTVQFLPKTVHPNTVLKFHDPFPDKVVQFRISRLMM
ncbi:MAG: hypothetical protein EBU88_16665 [Acidobacteria bacterium]|nr:hypothetical protein [Acidobacteriota bacterium]